MNGRFCSNYGQSSKKIHLGIFSIIQDALDGLFSFDTKLIHSFKPLILQPGYLTKEFLKGIRVRYMPPFKMFLFASFIAFLFIKRNHSPDKNSVNEDINQIADEIRLEIDSEKHFIKRHR